MFMAHAAVSQHSQPLWLSTKSQDSPLTCLRSSEVLATFTVKLVQLLGLEAGSWELHSWQLRSGQGPVRGHRLATLLTTTC